MFFSKNKKNRGFTLIELLVVISIAGLLISIANASFANAKQSAKISRAKAEIKQLQIAFEMFFNDHSDYPPAGRVICSGCSSPPNITWLDAANEISSYTGNKAPEKDPWGHYFGYVKTYASGCPDSWSLLCSAGPNGAMETNICQQDSVVGGDDICVFFPTN
jgi:type II secretion system protein G